MSWARSGSLTTAPPLRACVPALLCGVSAGSGSLTTAPPLREGVLTGVVPADEPFGQSYDCPSIAGCKRRTACSWTRKFGQSYDCPSIAGGIVASWPSTTPFGSGSLTTAPPLRACGRGAACAGQWLVRAVLRLPLHCGLQADHIVERISVFGQSYDCPSIAGGFGLCFGRSSLDGSGSLTTAPPLRGIPLWVIRRQTLRSGSLTTAPPLRA